MEIRYDADVDAMYIELRKGIFDHNKKVDGHMIVDYDKEGNILGIEILFVKANNPNLLQNIFLKNLVTSPQLVS